MRPNQKVKILVRNEWTEATVLAQIKDRCLLEYTYLGNHYLVFANEGDFYAPEDRFTAWITNPYGFRLLPKKWWRAMREAGTKPTNAPD